MYINLSVRPVLAPGSLIEAYAVCVCCNEEYVTSPFTVKQFKAWQAGVLIQDAFPDMPADDREFLISGICPAGWDKMNAEAEMEMGI